MRTINADDCEKYFYEHLDDNNIAGAMNAINEMPTVEPEQRWIPVTERLPKEDKPVFVYLFYDSPYIAWLSDGVWHTDDFIVDKDHEPAAWMPLPEPYREEGGQA